MDDVCLAAGFHLRALRTVDDAKRPHRDAVSEISTAAGVLLGTAAVDRMAARFPAARLYFVGVGLLCSAPFAALALSASSLIILKLSVAGFGLFGGCMMGTIFPAAYDVVDHRNYGFAVGILNLFGGLAGGTAIFFAGLWKGSLGIGSLMTAAAALSVAAAAVLLGVSRLRFRVDTTTVTDFAT